MHNNHAQGLAYYHPEKQQTEEDVLRQTLAIQYYNYISLLRQTNNFQQNPQIYANLDMQPYKNNVSLIGSLIEISLQKNNQDYLFPTIITTVNQNIFQQHQNPYAQQKFKPIKRKIIVSFAIYKKKLIIPLNKIMNICNRDKQLFVFTHLRLLLHEKTFYFGFSNQSYIIQLNTDFYRSMFRPMEMSLQYNYSQLNLNNIFKENDFPKGIKFSVQQIKNKVHHNLNEMVIVGVLKKVHWNTFDANCNPKEGEVAIEIIQDAYGHKYTSVGTCKIYVRFQLLHKQQIRAHMQEGCVYTCSIKDATIAQNLTITYKLDYWRQKFVKISSKIQRSINMQDIFKNMAVSPLNMLTHPCIFRNYYKFKVVKYDLKFFNASSQCQNCQAQIFMTQNKQFICRRQCGRVNGKLNLWAQIIVKDTTFTAQLSIQNQNVIEFFDLHEHIHTLKEQVVRSQQADSKKGITIYYKTMKDFTYEQFNYGVVYDRNQYITKFVERLLIVFVEKEVVVIPRVNNNQNYRNFNEDIKNQAQKTFAKTKQYFKKIKIFINGYIHNQDEEVQLVPYLKVYQVMS